MEKRRQRCECCKTPVTFRNYVRRDGLGMKVCGDCLQRGDKVYFGRGERDFTTFAYQTNPCHH